MSQLPDQIEEATAVSNRIRAALGCGEITEPHTPENVSRARLLRVRAGLCHVLTEIMPGITASAEREELYAWLFEIYSVTRIEECQARLDADKLRSFELPQPVLMPLVRRSRSHVTARQRRPILPFSV